MFLAEFDPFSYRSVPNGFVKVHFFLKYQNLIQPEEDVTELSINELDVLVVARFLLRPTGRRTEIKGTEANGCKKKRKKIANNNSKDAARKPIDRMAPAAAPAIR